MQGCDGYLWQSGEILAWFGIFKGGFEGGKVKIDINQRYALKDVAQAHIDLESRKTTGSTILIP